MRDRVAPEKTESLAVFPHNIQGVYGKVVNNMSIAEAKYDGIERVYDPLRGSRGKQGTYVYKIPCEQCGEILTKTQYNRSTNYLCDYCKGLIKKKKQALMTKELESVETKKEKQFRNAVEKIEKQVKDFSRYEKAISIAKTKAELYGSIPETMVAIELIRLGFSIIPQQRVKNYKVDFAIPKNKMVIEVDGSVFHKNKYGGDREAIIQLSLGLDWKIIHIPAELIADDIQKLKEVIKI